MKLKFLFLAFIAIFLLNSCENSSSSNNETKISSFNSDDSHNAGKNCMNCHKSGGDAEGWFEAAGTIYDNSGINTTSGVTIKLYTQINSGGSLVKTIQLDKNGNFYTTENINFSAGLFPVITSSNSNITKSMPQATTSGACNSCHDGVNEIKLKIN